MMKRIVFYGLLVLIISFGFGFGTGFVKNNRINLGQGFSSLSEKVSKKLTPEEPSNQILSVPPEEMRQFLNDSYRPKPDGRFLSALQVVQRFYLPQNQKTEPPAYEFKSDGKWHVRVKDMEIGTLPEFPNYGDLMDVLDHWVSILQERYPSSPVGKQDVFSPEKIQEKIDGFFIASQLEALKELNLSWQKGERSADGMRLAGKAMIRLYLQGVDLLEMDDLVPAQAMALMALSKRSVPEAETHNLKQDECLLAHLLGYSANAATICNSLPTTDPVSLYVNRRMDDLLNASLSPQGDPNDVLLTRYLTLLTLAELKRKTEYANFRDRHFAERLHDPAIIKANLGLNDFGSKAEQAFLLIKESLASLGKTEGDSLFDQIITQLSAAENEVGLVTSWLFGKNPLESVKNFEADLSGMVAPFQGPFLDGEAAQAYFRSNFYSGVYQLMRFTIDSLGSVSISADLAKNLNLGDWPAASELQIWFSLLIDSTENGAQANSRLLDHLRETRAIGFPALMRLYNEIKEYANYGDAHLFDAAKKLVSRMDTRVSHRLKLADMAYEDLYDLKLTQKILDGLSLSASLPEAIGAYSWYATLNKDKEMLLRLLETPGIDPSQESRLISSLVSIDGLDRLDIERRYEALISKDPRNWNIMKAYVDYLENNVKDYPKAIQALQIWVGMRGGENDFSLIFAKTALARILARDGQMEKALLLAKEAAQSGQAGALARYALILEKMGELKEAEGVFHLVIKRYPGFMQGIEEYTRLLWSQKRYQEAGQFLKTQIPYLTTGEWKFNIGKTFSTVFANKGSPQEGEIAFFNLIGSTKGAMEPFATLGNIPAEVNLSGDKELAYKTQIAIPGQGFGWLESQFQAYSSLKDWKGNEEAFAWLKKTIPASLLEPASMMAYHSNNDEVIWNLFFKDGQKPSMDFVWLMAAAAHLKETPSAEYDRHRQTLTDYYAAKSSNGSAYDQIGQYLLGLRSEKEVLELMKDPKKRCEVPFYLGMKALQEKRYSDASDWFHVAMETGLTRNGEYRWAYEILYNWYASGLSLPRIMQEDENGRVTYNLPPKKT